MRRLPETLPGLVGVLPLLKPPGLTSHDVVDEVRRAAGMRRVGHTGTLDPGACGVLVLCLGVATRISEYLTEQGKAYRAEFTFGVATDTGDAYGDVVEERDASHVTPEALEEALAAFRGKIQQTPPLVSAVRRGGRRLYEHARRGETVPVAPREVEIAESRLLAFHPGPRARALVHIECSKGTYVRALARDLGDRLGTGGYASFVLRTRSGAFDLSATHTLEEMQETAAEGRLPVILRSIDEALAHFPAVELTPAQRQQVLGGQPLPLFQVPGWARLPADRPIRLRDHRGVLALARIDTGRLRPFRVLRETGA